eukprot:COSAG04_NODE_608_length_12095_cov_54.626709_6_plen_198_part_00
MQVTLTFEVIEPRDVYVVGSAEGREVEVGGSHGADHAVVRHKAAVRLAARPKAHATLREDRGAAGRAGGGTVPRRRCPKGCTLATGMGTGEGQAAHVRAASVQPESTMHTPVPAAASPSRGGSVIRFRSTPVSTAFSWMNVAKSSCPRAAWRVVATPGLPSPSIAPRRSSCQAAEAAPRAGSGSASEPTAGRARQGQ